MIAVTPYIFDASALLAYLKDERGTEVVEELLLHSDVPCFAHAVNICEVYYNILALAGERAADSALAGLLSDGLTVREDLDPDMVAKAAHYKVGQQARRPIADCFCLALADRFNGEIVTADHPDFDGIAESGECRVRFIR